MATRCVQPPAPSTQHLESAARGRRPLEERHDAHARTLYGPSGTLPLLDHVYRPMTGEFCIQNPLVIARRECGISRWPKPSPSLALDLHAACGSAPCLSLALALASPFPDQISSMSTLYVNVLSTHPCDDDPSQGNWLRDYSQVYDQMHHLRW